MMDHHPVFNRFQCYHGTLASGYEADFIGSRNRLSFNTSLTNGDSRAVQTAYPPLNEEYFEWIDVLEAVVAAREKFTMVELGAGYGRWAVRAAAAVRQYSNLPLFLVAAEAEPTHFSWMHTHFEDNGLPPAEHRLVQSAITDHPGEALFYVGMPDGGNDAPDQWYGQALSKDYEVAEREFYDDQRREKIVEYKSGWKSMRVPCQTLSEIAQDLDFIDLIDLDVQGEELKVLSSSVDLLNARVGRLHIGTHSPEIEAGLRQLLSRQGWQCNADFAGCRENDTPFGPVTFLDGVQSWVNPRRR